MNDPQDNKTVGAPPIFKVKEVFFDFEGTLVDFQWNIRQAVKESLSALSRIGFKREFYGPDPGYAYIYNHTRSITNEEKDGHNNDMFILDTIYDKYDADALTRWSLYPDTLEVLEALRGRGFQIGLISNVGGETLQAAMQRLSLLDHITVVISRNDVKMLKPDPEGLLQAASAFGVDAAQCIFIGDSRNDMAAAREAGMLAAYVSGGEDPPDTCSSHRPDIEINRLNQLLSILQRED